MRVLESLPPGDPEAYGTVTVLDYIDLQERNDPHTGKTFELNEVRDYVTVERHHSGIDIVLELDIPQPWRERFFQASIGSTRLTEGPYARDWEKF